MAVLPYAIPGGFVTPSGLINQTHGSYWSHKSYLGAAPTDSRRNRRPNTLTASPSSWILAPGSSLITAYRSLFTKK